jgi:hypothetical protein
MPGSILDWYVSIPYDPGTNTYRYAKLQIIAEPSMLLELFFFFFPLDIKQ